MFDNNQFRQYIIRPSLQPIGLWNANAEELLVMTCAQESLGGKYLHQIKGPALGIFEMQPNTINDIWKNYLSTRISMLKGIYDQLKIIERPDDEVMVYNLRYATIMARVFYERIKENLPDAKDVEAMAKYYKHYYNTDLGAATIPEIISNYHKFIGV